MGRPGGLEPGPPGRSLFPGCRPERVLGRPARWRCCRVHVAGNLRTGVCLSGFLHHPPGSARPWDLIRTLAARSGDLPGTDHRARRGARSAGQLPQIRVRLGPPEHSLRRGPSRRRGAGYRDRSHRTVRYGRALGLRPDMLSGPAATVPGELAEHRWTCRVDGPRR